MVGQSNGSRDTDRRETRQLSYCDRLTVMKTAKPKGPATSEEYQRFEKFAKALMAVPKKELDRELAKGERGKASKRKPKYSGR